MSMNFYCSLKIVKESEQKKENFRKNNKYYTSKQ